MRRRVSLRSGNRAWPVLAVALAGCLLALGLTACEASKISISWDEGDSTTMTVPAGFQGELKINWNANGECPDPSLSRKPGAPVAQSQLVGFVQTGDGSGYFFVKIDSDGQYSSTVFQLECDTAAGTRSNYLQVKVPGPVYILIVHPAGLAPLPQGVIQTRDIDGSYLSTKTYKTSETGVVSPFGPGFPYIGRTVGVPGQEVRVKFKPPPDGQFWTGTCPSSPATFVVRPGDQVDDSGYANPSCAFRAAGSMQGWSDPVDAVKIRAVTPLAVVVSGPSDDAGLYGIRVRSADAGGFRLAAEVCASAASTSCTAKVVPGDTATVGLKPPTDAGMALQGTCPSGATFQITTSSAIDADGYATACPSFTPTDPTTDISVQKVPAQAADGISVSVSGSTLSITASGQMAPGDLEIAGNASQIRVYVPEETTGPVTVTPGAGCSASGTGVACQPSGGPFQAITISLIGASFTSGPLSIALTDTTAIPVTFSGSLDRDEFYSGSGSDTIRGYGGNDALFGGEGDDAVFGGDGADVIDGEGGSDTVYGDAGPDNITAEGDGKAPDWINCNNFMPGVVGTDNDPANPPTNDVSFDKGADRITDCGEPGAPGVTKPPALTGTPTVGRNYVASPGTWTGKGLIMSYTWFACPKVDDTVPINDDEDAGACAQVFAQDGTPGLTYLPKAADKDTFLKLRATARNNAGFWTVVSTARAAVVLPKR